MSRLAVCAVLVLAVGACDAARKDRLAFDGEYFRSKAAKVDGDRRQIEVTVKPASASITGAQEAGRHEATVYCIENYGSSAVDWVVGPDDDPASYVLDGDVLMLRGACAE